MTPNTRNPAPEGAFARLVVPGWELARKEKPMVKARFILSLVFLLALSVSAGEIRLTLAAPATPATTARQPAAIPDQYIVVLKDDAVPEKVADEMKQKYGLNIRHTYKYAAKGFSAKIPASKLDAVKNDPRVKLVSEDKEVRAINPGQSSLSISETVSTLTTTADAYVDKSYPTTTYGTGTSLRVDGSPVQITYLKFNTSAYAGKTLTSAKLKVKTTSSSSAGSTSTQNIKIANNNTSDGKAWSESTITYNYRPSISSTVLGSVSNTKANTWYTINLNAASVQPKVGGTLTIALTSTGSDNLYLKSRETTDKPQLILGYESQSLPTGIDRIDAENKTNKGTGVGVAVLDTGIDLTHPDLKNNIAGGKSCIDGVTSYSDGNGHGTHVAGTIAAENNGVGVVGVAPEAKVWAVKVLRDDGGGDFGTLMCGLDFVTANADKIKVVNMSLEGGGSNDNNCGYTNNDVLHQTICKSRDAGITFVVAAGNAGKDAAGVIPGNYDDAVITVSALADSDGMKGGKGPDIWGFKDDTFASFSNYGSNIDLGAPGVEIYSTYPGGYEYLTGTSMAAPHVAGAAALYLYKYPSSNWKQVRDGLKSSGEALNAGHTDPSGKHPEPVVNVKDL